MNNEEAKRILSLYRPGTADQADADFAEALQLAQSDPELAAWHKALCASYARVRAKFLQIPTPTGLKDQIMNEANAPAKKIIPFPPMVLLGVAAAIALCLSLTTLLWPAHDRQDNFDTYRNRMARTALQPYGMPLQSHDFQSIKTFFSTRNAPADYVLPDGVTKAEPVGCAILRWQGQPVSMLCFRTGKPLSPGANTDLWLFVVNQSSVKDGPASAAPVMAQVASLSTASWSQDGKTYLLATVGDETALRKYF